MGLVGDAEDLSTSHSWQHSNPEAVRDADHCGDGTGEEKRLGGSIVSRIIVIGPRGGAIRPVRAARVLLAVLRPTSIDRWSAAVLLWPFCPGMLHYGPARSSNHSGRSGTGRRWCRMVGGFNLPVQTPVEASVGPVAGNLDANSTATTPRTTLTVRTTPAGHWAVRQGTKGTTPAEA